MPAPVERLAKRYMRDPKRVNLSEDNVVVDTVDQYYTTVDEDRKFGMLVRILACERPRQAVVFTRHEAGGGTARSQVLRQAARRRHDERRPSAGEARPGHDTVSGGQNPPTRGNRRRGTRHRCPRDSPTSSITISPRTATTTCTASAARVGSAPVTVVAGDHVRHPRSGRAAHRNREADQHHASRIPGRGFRGFPAPRAAAHGRRACRQAPAAESEPQLDFSVA